MKRVFIIHGWTYNLDKWHKEIQALPQLGIEPVMLKVPGLTEASNKVWTITDYVSWLDKELEGTHKPIVIGHSNGGRIALSYAQKFPGRLGQLILIDSAGVPHNQKRSRVKLKTLKALSVAGKPLANIKPLRKTFYRIIGAQDYFKATPNMRATMANMLAADQQIEFASFRLPVTIIWGRNDTITPLSDGEFMHKKIIGSSLHIIDDARHAPFFSHPNQVADFIAAAIKD